MLQQEPRPLSVVGVPLTSALMDPRTSIAEILIVTRHSSLGGRDFICKK